MRFARWMALATAAGIMTAAEPIGRPVRVVSLSFSNQPLPVIRDVVDAEAAKGADLVILPETWRGQKNDTMEALDGETTRTMSALAVAPCSEMNCTFPWAVNCSTCTLAGSPSFAEGARVTAS